MTGLVRIRNRLLARWRDWRAAPTAAARARAEARLGDTARDAGDWSTASRHYASALALTPDDVGTLLQQGHVLKAAGRIAEAAGAYRAAIDARPDFTETYLHLAEMLRANGRRNESIDVFVEALNQDPSFAPARAAMIALGERRRLPAGSYGSRAVLDANESVARTLETLGRSIRDWTATSTYPASDYGAWRRAYPPPLPPPLAAGPHPAILIVDGRNQPPSALAASLRSLQDQRHPDWTALVLASAEAREHAIALTIDADPRMRLDDGTLAGVRNAFEKAPAAMTAWMPAGSVLDTAWLSWVVFASETTGADAVYTDHDRLEMDWREGPRRSDPALQGQPCPDDLATSPRPPLAVAFAPALRDALLSSLSAGRKAAGVRDLLLKAFASGPVVHVPLVLASHLAEMDSPPTPVEQPSPGDEVAIRVIIPTRDHTDLLERFVKGLMATAEAPSRVHIVVMDNRSGEASLEAFTRLRSNGVDVRTVDEPFNWSRINGLGASDGDEPILVFANNDMEMLTPGWDTRLSGLLADETHGVVGARLLYPDGTLQHAGVAIGVNQGRPFHEGRLSPAHEGGPLERWKRLRSAAAVTGAFLAVRRAVFEAAGGFDEAMAIGYSDLDLCFRVRRLGLRVVMDGALELIHHESKTRGMNGQGEKIAWDDHELRLFHERWGDWLFFDPSINPQWLCEQTRPFDGYREAGARRVLDWLEQAQQCRAWAIDESRRPPETR